MANQQIARRCEVDSDTVRRWRDRFVHGGPGGVGVIAKGAWSQAIAAGGHGG
jgi:transposase-like protein